VIDASALRGRLADVRARIARAAGRAGRDPATIRLVAVSKTFPAELVRAAAGAGRSISAKTRSRKRCRRSTRAPTCACAGISSGIFNRTK
jgi:uncharacterized pyridoxal phosphate-containing UPF0001 family protein